MPQSNDRAAIAAIGVGAMCLVTVDHEALGHGSACLLEHGHILLLSSSLFRCDAQSGWIAAAGPLFNLAMGTLALISLRWIPTSRPGTRLLLTTITAFSYFWEGGYAVRAMRRRDGDLYFAAQALWEAPPPWFRLLAAAAGLLLFVWTFRWTARSLSALWPETAEARRVGRTLWLSATAGAALAALAYRGEGWGDLRDAVLEIGAASFPLLFVPFGRRRAENPMRLVVRSNAGMAVAVGVYALFVATIGRGVGG